MEEIECFACGTLYDPAATQYKDRCDKCGWGGGQGIHEDDSRYLVLLSLSERAEEVKDKEFGFGDTKQWLRLEPTAREYAVLEHGDQICVDDQIWRITSKTDGIFWMRKFEVGGKRIKGFRV